ncbi:MAG: hypothetical protein EOO09_14420 [Chitinophagaceae bacterium]|nr:MAG: hypothetical protein EOO09_14420 [Chitinophagaceae bacterium]
MIQFKKLAGALLVITLPLAAFSQDVKTKACEYRTDGKSGAHGMRLSFWVPCNWNRLEPTNESILASYSQSLPDSGTLTHTLTIDKMPQALPPEQLSGLFSSDGMKMIARQHGKYVSGSKVRIGEWDAAEIRYWNQYKQGNGMLYSYGVQYYLPMGDKIINISYLTGSGDKDQSKKLFAAHEEEFRTAAKTLLVR